MRRMSGQVIGAGATWLAAAVWLAQASAQPGPDRSWRTMLRKPGATAPTEPRGVAGLPDAHGRRFATLDAYLAHLRAYAAPVDRPWYREVAPDRFRLERGNLRTATPPPTFTRAQLERKFGFRH